MTYLNKQAFFYSFISGSFYTLDLGSLNLDRAFTVSGLLLDQASFSSDGSYFVASAKNYTDQST